MVNADCKLNEPYKPNEPKKQNIRRLVCPTPVYAVGIS